ncbi:hypothetical protein B0H13DRAFT_2333450 [Mycena leptocephala]|nr:hypothetical protein B0H13DRAFT_2333450 [Mycena leptocephala]
MTRHRLRPAPRHAARPVPSLRFPPRHSFAPRPTLDARSRRPRSLLFSALLCSAPTRTAPCTLPRRPRRPFLSCKKTSQCRICFLSVFIESDLLYLSWRQLLLSSSYTLYITTSLHLSSRLALALSPSCRIACLLLFTPSVIHPPTYTSHPPGPGPAGGRPRRPPSSLRGAGGASGRPAPPPTHPPCCLSTPSAPHQVVYLHLFLIIPASPPSSRSVRK